MASGGSRSGTYEPTKGDPKYLTAALALIGIPEAITVAGKKRSNPQVQEFFKATDPEGKTFGVKPNTLTVAWCAIFINHVLKIAKLDGTGSAMARSFLKWGNEVCTLNGRGTVTSGSWDNIRPGDIGVKWRGSANDGVSGHVFIVTAVGKNWIEGVGGNQGDSVSIERFKRAQMLGVRRPRSAAAKESVAYPAAGAAVGVVERVANATIPEPTTLDAIAQGAEKAKGPLEQLATVKPWATGLLAAISIALVAYGVYKATRNIQQRS